MEAAALLAEALGLAVLHEAAQLEVLLADAVALVVLLLFPDVLVTSLNLHSFAQVVVQCILWPLPNNNAKAPPQKAISIQKLH